MGSEIVIRDYDPQWPRLYEAARLRILRAVGERLVAIEHVGSTAVPGLAAKPIIDIMGGVSRLAEAERCISGLEAIGYEYVPEYEAVMPERRYFRKGPPEGRTHHLHLVEHGGPFWQDNLLFRDCLRANPDIAQRYEELKRILAPRFTDGNAYADAKTPFIEGVMEGARAALGSRPTSE